MKAAKDSPWLTFHTDWCKVLTSSSCASQQEGGKPAEEPGFGLHYKFYDFWVVSSREATRCCCKASKGPDGQGREMCRKVSGRERSLLTPATDQLWGPGLAEHNDSGWSRPAWHFCWGIQPNMLTPHHTTVLCNWWKAPKATWELTGYPESFVYCQAREGTDLTTCLVTPAGSVMYWQGIPLSEKLSSLLKRITKIGT